MNSKSRILKIIFFSAVILLGNSFFIVESTAFFTYRSTTPLWYYSLGRQFATAVEVSSDGAYITAICQNMVSNINDPEEGTLYLFNNSISTNKSPLWNYSIQGDFSSVAISPDGNYIIAGGGHTDRKVYFFTNSNPLPIWTYLTGGCIYDVEISSDGSYAAVASGQNRRVFLFNTTDVSPIKGYTTSGLALRVALSSDGTYLAATDNAANLYFYNISNISKDWNFELSGDMSVALSISGDGNFITSGGDKLYNFNSSSSIPIWTFNGSDQINSIKISQNGNFIVAGGCYSDNNVYFFNRSNPIPEWTYPTNGEIASVDISDNGNFIIAHSYDQFIYLFNKNSSTPIWKYKLDGYYAESYDYSLGISSDGKYIAVAGRHYIYLFDRDIITQRQIVEGYGAFITILTIVILILVVVVAIFPLNNKKKRNSLEKS